MVHKSNIKFKILVTCLSFILIILMGVFINAETQSFGQWQTIGEYTTDSNGYLSDDKAVQELIKEYKAKGYTEFRIVETKAAKGYEIGDKNTYPLNDKELLIKNKLKPGFTLKKVDEKGNLLSGAQFVLVKEVNNKFIEVSASAGSSNVYTTDKNGEIIISPSKLADLANGVYAFKEIKAPTGYLLPTDNQALTGKFTINNGVASPKVITKVNQSYKFNFEKHDKATNQGLANVEFQVQKLEDNKWVDVTGASYVTNAEGNIQFSKQQLAQLGNGTYRFKETKALSGYEELTEANKYSQKFVISDNMVSPATIVMNNTPVKKGLTFKKVSSKDNSALAGVMFILQEKDGNSWKDLSGTTYTTDANGQIILSDKQINALGNGIYRFEETKALNGYEALTEDNKYSPEFVVGTYDVSPSTIQMQNNPVIRVVLAKEDGNNRTSIAGAQFALQIKKVIMGPITGYSTIEKVNSDENGLIYFDIDKPGDYQIIELTPGNGYVNHNEYRQFTITEADLIPGQLYYVNKDGLLPVDDDIDLNNQLPSQFEPWQNYRIMAIRKEIESRNVGGNIATWNISLQNLPKDLASYKSFFVYDNLIYYLKADIYENVYFTYTDNNNQKHSTLLTEGVDYVTGTTGEEFSGNQYMMWNFNPSSFQDLIADANLETAKITFNFKTIVSNDAPTVLQNQAQLFYTNGSGYGNTQPLPSQPDPPALP